MKRAPLPHDSKATPCGHVEALPSGSGASLKHRLRPADSPPDAALGVSTRFEGASYRRGGAPLNAPQGLRADCTLRRESDLGFGRTVSEPFTPTYIRKRALRA